MTNDERNFLTDYSQFLDASGEHLTYSALSIYRNFSDELSQKEKNFLKKHLDSCPHCSAQLQEVADVEGNTVEQQPKTGLHISPVIFRYAIAAVLIVAVGLSVIFVSKDFQQKKIPSNENTIDKSLAVITSNPAKFIPNQVLENFIERTVRSSLSITLLAPTSGDTITTPFTFKWERKQAEDIVTVTIVNNKNVEIWRGKTSSTKLVYEKNFDPGLYYVKLEMNEKLVCVGKFVVLH